MEGRRRRFVVPSERCGAPGGWGHPPDPLNKGAWCGTQTDVRMSYTRRPPWCSRAPGLSTRCQGTSSGARCGFCVMMVSAREICFMRMDIYCLLVFMRCVQM